MRREFCLAWLVLVLATGSSQGQEWARKMFNETSFDFANLARGAKAVHYFQVKNIYEETVHIAGVRSSCGCTTPKIVNPTIKTFETGEIVAEFNTIAFRGQHSATLTVLIDAPFRAEVQLQVFGNVRSDVVFQPGVVAFGAVPEGTPATKTVSVRYAGRDDWRIEDVRCANASFEVEINETARGGGRVAYDLAVRLKENAPIGYISEPLILVTNDAAARRIPLPVEGRIVPEISVSPGSLVLGNVRVGQKVTKKLVVSSASRQPFKILGVDCDDDSFRFRVKDEQKTFHLLEVDFEPTRATGKLRKTIHIRTDRARGEITLTAMATVVASDAPTP
ncbi:MAG: DUF1573 domain-containing protein [Pirellulales bacterium]